MRRLDRECPQIRRRASMAFSSVEAAAPCRSTASFLPCNYDAFLLIDQKCPAISLDTPKSA